jgi:actin-related protein 10
LQDVWDSKYLHRNELYLILCRFLQTIYLQYLMVNPKDYRVVVVEPLLCPTSFRNTLARAFFSHFSVPYVAFIPSPLLCLFSIGRQTALVVDVGWQETTVLPIYEGIPVISAWQSTSCAAKTVHNTVLQSVLERGTVKSSNALEDKPLYLKSGIETALEDIIVSTCAVPAKDYERMPPSVEFPLNKHCTLSIHGRTRSTCAETLFVEEVDDQPIPRVILDSLLKCSSDCRRALSENILVVGGVASLPGFNYRLKQELERLVADKCQHFNCPLEALEFKFQQPPAHTSTAAWVGGSIFGCSEIAVLERAVSKDRFKEMNQHLPDWSSCDPNQQEGLRPLPIRKLLPAAPTSLFKSNKSEFSKSQLPQ